MAIRSVMIRMCFRGKSFIGPLAAIVLSFALPPSAIVRSQETTSPTPVVSGESGAEFWIHDDSAEVEIRGIEGEPVHHGEFSHPPGYGVNHAAGFPHKPHREKPGDRNWSACPPARYEQCSHCRAGFPHDIARWAKPSANCHYAGGYVGGGSALRGRGRKAEEGTWGLDYRGILSPRRVFLPWTCGREQGGEGAYKTDGEYSPL
jgi:hypothetical protein